MKVKDVSGVKVYDLSVGKTLPQWISDKQRRSLSKDEEYRRRIELVQDFWMPTSSQRIKMTRDNSHIVVSGTYPPIVKVYDVRELSLKFERHLNSDIVQFECLSDDYAKLVFLGADRSLTFHAAFGMYYSTRVPRFGRDMLYDRSSCDLFVCGSSSEVYRLNLEQGTFRLPYQTNLPGVNTMAQAEQHRLLALGGDNGVIECWDPRAKAAVRSHDVAEAIAADGSVTANQNQVTALSFSESGLNLLVGTHSGHCALYDIRSSKPLIIKEHQYATPIKKVSFQKGGQLAMSADAKVIKMWDTKTGDAFTNIESEQAINDVWVVDGPRGQSSGLLLVANEQDRVKSFYVPQYGPAPRWSSFLDNLTEELEESHASTVYDDYKFVTKPELEQLGVSHLVGTPLLKAYMHGFFMDMRLHTKIRALAKPFEFEEWRKAKIKEKIDSKRAGRIQLQEDNAPKVNRAVSERLTAQTKEDPKRRVRKSGGSSNAAIAASKEILVDPRFQTLFEDPDFQIDEESEQFMLVHPSGTGGAARSSTREDMDSDEEDVNELSDIEEEEDEEEGSSNAEEEEEEEEEEKKVVGTSIVNPGKKTSATSATAAASAGISTKKRKLVKLVGSARSSRRGVDEDPLAFASSKAMHGANDEDESNMKLSSRKAEASMTLAKRVQVKAKTDLISHKQLSGGNFELTFVPSNDKKEEEEEGEESASSKKKGRKSDKKQKSSSRRR